MQEDRSRSTAGAASQCYKDELMLLKCELMLLKCQINSNTKKVFFASYKMFRKGIEILILLVLIILNYQFPKTTFADFFVLILDFNSISSHSNSNSSHSNSISSRFNSISLSQ